MYSKILLYTIFILLVSCQGEENFVRDYPTLNDVIIDSNSKDGVTVTANIGSENLDNVIEYGFSWEGSYNEMSTLFTGKPSTSFSANINYRLVSGRSYKIRSVVRTKDRTVYGLFTGFVSKGSKSTIIEGVNPKRASLGDLVTISGQGFGSNPSGAIIVLAVPNTNGYRCAIKSYSDTQIVIEIPTSIRTAATLQWTPREGEKIVTSESIQLN